MDSFMLYNDICLEDEAENMKSKSEKEEGGMSETKTENYDDEKGLWNMDFDGADSKEGVGAGIWILTPFQKLWAIQIGTQL